MRKALTFLASAVMIWGLAVYFSPLRPRRSRYYYFYVCTGCGLQRSVKEWKLGPVTYRGRTDYHPTSVSNALGTNGCGHAWLLYDRGESGRAKTVASGLPGGERRLVSIYVLLDDEMAASELARMDEPREKWRLLVTALETNRALNDSLVRWSQELPYRRFSSWWQQSSLAK